MSILEILLLGIGLSMDAFAVSICKGLSAKRLQTRHYLIIGAWFGGFQALMPTIGFFLGSTFEQYITAFDHWVAFVLLSAIGAGMIQYCTLGVTDAQEQAFRAMLAPAGRLDAIPEQLIDAASCVSGCGPAFAYLFMEALADGGVACGLPREQALRYAAQMVAGSAEMVLQSGRHPGQLKDAVCSPGGTTIQGVRALEANGFRSAAMEAVLAAYEKTLKLGK